MIGDNNTIGGPGGGDTLTDAQKATLKHVEYSESTERVEVDRPMSVELDSIYFGKEWKVSSGGAAYIFTNLSNSISYYAAMAGLKDQSILANQDVTGVIQPFVSVPSDDLIELEPNGVATAGSVDAAYTYLAAVSGFFFSAEYITTDAITADEWLHFEVFQGSDTSGRMLYMHDTNGYTADANATVKIQFDHPLLVNDGQTVTIVLYRRTSRDDEAETYLTCRPGTTFTDLPYRKLELRTVTNESISHSGNSVMEKNGTVVSPATPGDSIQTHDYVYIGDPDTNGSGRMYMNGNILSFETRAGGVWNFVGGFS